MGKGEIVIVGGGLAGLSLGIFLRQRGVAVRIVEAGGLPRHRVCGEFVCGVEREVLEQLGVWEVYAGAVRHESMRWWMGSRVGGAGAGEVRLDLELERELPMVAYGVSRYVVDLWLARRFEQLGGMLELGRRFAGEDAQGVVWACGKDKSVGRAGGRRAGGRGKGVRFGRAASNGGWMGLKVHVRDGGALDREFGRGLGMFSGAGGYVGTCAVEDGRANVCGLFRVLRGRGAPRGKGMELMRGYLEAAGLGAFGERLADWDVDEGSFRAVAGFGLGEQRRRGGFCVGDAARMIAPFSGNGMSMALESAWVAGPWLLAYARGECSWERACAGLQRQTARLFGRRMAVARVLHPWLFGKTGRGLLRLGARTGLLPFEGMFAALRR